MPASRRFLTGAALLLGLALSGCGFSGALYLPEENSPPPQEQPVPEENNVQDSPAILHDPSGSM